MKILRIRRPRGSSSVAAVATFLLMLGVSVLTLPQSSAAAASATGSASSTLNGASTPTEAELATSGFSTVAPYAVPGPPAKSYAFSPPAICLSQPTGQRCQLAAVGDLDLARQHLGLGPYRLPAGFFGLAPVEQTFVLTNLDRRSYGEPAFQGISATLSRWSASTLPRAPVWDPAPSSSTFDGARWYVAGGNSAAGYPNALYAYAGWMYDDGYGGHNVFCNSAGSARCWGHRANILGNYRTCYGSSQPGCVGGTWVYLADLSYGGAIGTNLAGKRAFTQLFAASTSSPAAYSYTWDEAVAAGAGRSR